MSAASERGRRSRPPLGWVSRVSAVGITVFGLVALCPAVLAQTPPGDDADACRRILDEASVLTAAKPCFARWVRTADREGLLEAAITGGPALRVLALEHLLDPPTASIVAFPRTPSPAASSRLTTQERQRLLTSIAEVLSLPPGRSSAEVTWQAARMLLDVADGDMEMALRYADAVPTRQERYAASAQLSQQDSAAYARTRRPPRAWLAFAVVLAGAVLARARRARIMGVALALSGAAWMVTTWMTTSPRELPPLPLAPLTVTALAFLTGGLVVGASSVLSSTAVQSTGRLVAVTFAQVIGAAGASLMVTAWTRAARVFPLSPEGWNLVYEPIGAMLLAGLWALLLLALLGVARRLTPTVFVQQPPA